ncbi:MAG: hypothetical protein QGI45_08975, partial [Myxococcota bacterium]|nr:hypothetical protein [Myxococcota bacterium]
TEVSANPLCTGANDEPAYCSTACEELPPLRATVSANHGGYSGMRMAYPENTGIHGINIPEPEWEFDYFMYHINQIGRFFQSKGQELIDDPCLEDSSCAFLNP